MTATSAQTIILSAVASAIVSAIVSIGTVEYRLRREQAVSSEQENEDWYADAAKFGRDVRRKWERDFEEHRESFSDYDGMKAKMRIFAEQLDSHASEGENLGVDEEVVEKLRECSSSCRGLSEVRIFSDRGPWIEAGETVTEKAKQLEEVASRHT